MKFWGGLILLVLLVNVNPDVLADDRVNTEAGITFYQENNANQVVPMKKVALPKQDSPKKTQSPVSSDYVRFLPQTNESTSWGLFLIGLIVVSYVLVRRWYKKFYE